MYPTPVCIKNGHHLIKHQQDLQLVQVTEYEIPKMTCFWLDPKRGIALIFDKELNAKECEKLNNSGFELKTVYGVWMMTMSDWVCPDRVPTEVLMNQWKYL